VGEEQLLRFAAGTDSGVVDQQIQPAVSAVGVLHQPGHRVRVAYVHDSTAGTPRPLLGEARGMLGDRVPVDVGEHDGGAAPYESPSERGTDPRAAARDNRGPRHGRFSRPLSKARFAPTALGASGTSPGHSPHGAPNSIVRERPHRR
jgi:hypothetical protein